MTVATQALAMGSAFHWNPNTASIAVFLIVGLLGFALVKWGGVPWWGLLLGIIFGIFIAATHFLGPQIMHVLGTWTNGNLL